MSSNPSLQLLNLTIDNYRNFLLPQTFNFTKSLVVFIGQNSVGKTNILEAIYLLNRGSGFREKKTEELLNKLENPLKIKAIIQGEKEKLSLDFIIKSHNQLISKNYLVNGFKKPLKEYLNQTLPVVLFEPNDIELIIGTPEKRRTFFDRLLSRVSYEYYVSKVNFEKGLYKRNKLLENFHHRSQELEDLLEFWDDYLIKNGSYLQEKRQLITDYFNKLNNFGVNTFKITYQQNILNKTEFSRVRDQEIRYGKTLIGPQLDDFIFSKLEKNHFKKLGSFGSRSEQRMGVLWLKLTELHFLQSNLSKKPILLLDDIFSEFDETNAQRIFELCSKYQVFITTAQIGLLNKFGLPYQEIVVN